MNKLYEAWLQTECSFHCWATIITNSWTSTYVLLIEYWFVNPTSHLLLLSTIPFCIKSTPMGRQEHPAKVTQIPTYFALWSLQHLGWNIWWCITISLPVAKYLASLPRRHGWEKPDNTGTHLAVMQPRSMWTVHETQCMGKIHVNQRKKTMWTCTGKWVALVTIQIWTLMIWDWASRIAKHSGTGGRWVVQSKEHVPPGWKQLPPEGPMQTKAGPQTQTESNRDHPCPQERNAGLRSFITQRTEKKVPTTVYWSILKHFQVYYNQWPHRLCLYPCRTDNWRRKIQIESDVFSFSVNFSKIPSKKVLREWINLLPCIKYSTDKFS